MDFPASKFCLLQFSFYVCGLTYKTAFYTMMMPHDIFRNIKEEMGADSNLPTSTFDGLSATQYHYLVYEPHHELSVVRFKRSQNHVVRRSLKVLSRSILRSVNMALVLVRRDSIGLQLIQYWNLV